MKVSPGWFLPFFAVAAAACVPAANRAGAGGSTTPRDYGGARGQPEGVIDLPEVIRATLRIPRSRTVVASRDVRIEPGGRLELAAGDVVRFAAGTGLHVHGGELIAMGTERDRILLTSAAESPQPGDWCGVTFDATELPEDRPTLSPASALEQVVVEYAGHPWEFLHALDRAAGISIVGYLGDQKHDTKPGAVVLKSVELRNNASRGLDVQSNAPLTLERLIFGHNAGVSIRTDLDRAERCASFATESVELVGTGRGSVTLPTLSVPYVAVESLVVGSFSDEAPPVLTIPPGTVFKFRKETYLMTGGYLKGKIVAHGVTFTSAESEPAPGDWGGIVLSYMGQGDFDGDTFEYAGMQGHALAVSKTGHRRLELRNSRFRRNAAPAIDDSVSCAKWRDPARKNVFEDQPACVRNRR